MSLRANLSQVVHSILARARPPMMAPEVGVKRFTTPMAAEKIMTMTSGEKPSLTASGPMMGMAQYTADIPVAKGTGAILAFCEKEEQTVEHPQCIRCGKCVAACPVHLEPLFMYQYAEKGMVDELNEAHIMDCMECGACSYICPARMHLTHMFKTGKQLVKDKAAADRAAAEAKKKAEEAKEAAAK